MTQVTTIELKLHVAREFLSSIVEQSLNCAVYAFIGNHVDPSSTRPLFDAPYWTSIDPYGNMIAGKRAGAADGILMIRDVPWTSNVTYAMYDDSDPELYSKDFYVIVTDGSFSHAFKCLDNNNDSPSTAAPDFGDVSPSDEVYQTADGYRWKYMFTVDDSIRNKFFFEGYVPVVPNTSVENSAAAGAIDIVKVLDGGAGYTNYLSGSFGSADVRVGGNNFVFSLSGNAGASASNGFYTGCILYVASGTGSGQSRRVTDYFSNSVGRFVVIDREFGPHPTNGSGWEISPEVVITGSGTETIAASARALVNAVGNSIYRVEVLSRGEGYTVATAEVVANSIVPVTSPSSVRVIYQPPGGHGYDAAAELGCTRVGVSVKFDGSESNTIPYGGEFGQLGLLRCPRFSGVTLNLSQSNGTFFEGETVTAFTKRLLDSGATTVSGNSVVSSNSGAFDLRLDQGDLVYLIDSDQTKHHASRVVSVVNATHVSLADSVGWSCTAVSVFLATPGETGTVTGNPFSNVVMASDVSGPFSPGDEVMVMPGGGWGVVDSVERGGMVKGFDTFVGLTRLVGSLAAGSFVEGEFVYQGGSLAEATSSGRLHSVETDGSTVTLFVSNRIGAFDGPSVLGANSSAQLTVTDVVDPEVEPGSGRILYLQNIEPVERSDDQTESINVLLDFG